MLLFFASFDVTVELGFPNHAFYFRISLVSFHLFLTLLQPYGLYACSPVWCSFGSSV